MSATLPAKTITTNGKRLWDDPRIEVLETQQTLAVYPEINLRRTYMIPNGVSASERQWENKSPLGETRDIAHSCTNQLFHRSNTPCSQLQSRGRKTVKN